MIGRLRGTLLEQGPDRVVVETAAGVGYEVRTAPRTLSELPATGSEVTLHVHTQVAETAITLYGFLSPQDKQLFRTVQTVSGIGPKLALAVAGTCDPAALAQAILREDIAGLSRIPGLGKKTAGRLCLELKDKLDSFMGPGELGDQVVLSGGPQEPAAVEDARAALAALGYNGREIKKALSAAAPVEDDTVQTILRRALKALSPS
ncbi:MAG: Holliday junction branch migration protein RuvA [Myxococcota bacterium]|nr:Holliday junction branch migration protein RuvA [Myxococcota bacterium]